MPVVASVRPTVEGVPGTPKSGRPFGTAVVSDTGSENVEGRSPPVVNRIVSLVLASYALWSVAATVSRTA